MNLADVLCWTNARYVFSSFMLCVFGSLYFIPLLFFRIILSAFEFFPVLIQKHLFIIRVIHKEREIYDSFLLILLYSSWSFDLFGSCDSSFSKEGQDEKTHYGKTQFIPHPKVGDRQITY